MKSLLLLFNHHFWILNCTFGNGRFTVSGITVSFISCIRFESATLSGHSAEVPWNYTRILYFSQIFLYRKCHFLFISLVYVVPNRILKHRRHCRLEICIIRQSSRINGEKWSICCCCCCFCPLLQRYDVISRDDWNTS